MLHQAAEQLRRRSPAALVVYVAVQEHDNAPVLERFGVEPSTAVPEQQQPRQRQGGSLAEPVVLALGIVTGNGGLDVFRYPRGATTRPPSSVPCDAAHRDARGTCHPAAEEPVGRQSAEGEEDTEVDSADWGPELVTMQWEDPDAPAQAPSPPMAATAGRRHEATVEQAPRGARAVALQDPSAARRRSEEEEKEAASSSSPAVSSAALRVEQLVALLEAHEAGELRCQVGSAGMPCENGAPAR